MPIQLSHQVTNPPVSSSLAEGGKLTQITAPLMPILVCPFVPFHRLREDMNLLQRAGDQPTTAHKKKTSGNYHSPAASFFCSRAFKKHTRLRGSKGIGGAEGQTLLMGKGNFTYKPQLSPPRYPLPPGTAADNLTTAFKSGLWPFAYFLAKVREAMENLAVSVWIQTESTSVPYRVCSLSSFQFLKLLLSPYISVISCAKAETNIKILSWNNPYSSAA